MPRALSALVIAAVVGDASPLFAERQTFRTFTSQQGLAQIGVRALVQDHDGHLWIATQAGLDRFDGRRFHVFESHDGLGDEGVLSLLLDDDGSLWIGTGSGLDRIRDGMIENVFSSTALRTKALARGRRPGEVWVGTTVGLARWDGTTLDFRPELLGNSVFCLFVARDGSLLIGAQDGLWRLSGDELRRFGPWDATSSVRAITEERDGRLWVAQNHEIFTFDGVAWSEALRMGELAGDVTALHVDALGELWIGGHQGVKRWSREQQQLRTFGLRDGLRIGEVTAITEDRDGRLWLGGFGGIASFVGRAFEIFDADDGLPSSYVRPLLRDHRGDLMVGTLAGLARWTGERFEVVDPGQSFTGRYVISMYEDPRGWLWVGTAVGLTVRTPSGWLMRPYDTGADAIGSIVGDAAGRVWIAQENVGILQIVGDRVERLVPPDNPLTHPRLCLDRSGALWVSGDQGLSVLRGGQWTTWGVAHGLAHPSPYYLAEDRTGAIWFGYYGSVGVTRFDGHGFRTWTTRDGLADDSVYDIGFDRRGNTWIGSARGVTRFDGHSFQTYGPQEGFPSTESNSGGFLEEPDGRIWFATAEGLGRYDPSLDRIAIRSPTVRFETLRVGRVELSTDGLEVSPDDHDLEVDLEVLSFVHPSRVSLRARLLGSADRWMEVTDERLLLPQLRPGAYRLEVESRVYERPWEPAVSRDFVILTPWWERWWAIAGGVFALVLLAFGATRWRLHALAEQNRRLEAMVRERTAVLEAQAETLTVADANLHRLNVALLEANRAKSELIANVSHDLRTPMNGILGMTELALGEEIPPRARGYLETVRVSGRTLLELIDELLDLSRIEAGRITLDPVPFLLRSFLAEARGVLLVSAAEKDLELELTVAPEVPDGWRGDVARLRRVLVNLVGNAIKFTQVGSVRVDVDLTTIGGAQALRFRVRDSGVGIPADRLDAIFESFTQADGSITRRFGGTGLGLTISRQLVTLMGGQISVESVLGQGSTFTFTVVLEPAPDALLVPPVAEPLRPREGAPAASLEVLVAEDNVVNQLVVRRMLERLGHRVHLVEDGAQAVAVALARRWDVVLMDVQMPVLGGLDATQQIRAREESQLGGRRVPILALTANGMSHDRARSLHAGMDGHLTKPITLDALETALLPIVEQVAAARASGQEDSQQSQGASGGPTQMQRS